MGPPGEPIGGLENEAIQFFDLRKFRHPGEKREALDPLGDGIDRVSRLEVQVFFLITGHHGGGALLDEKGGGGLIDLRSLREVVEPTQDPEDQAEGDPVPAPEKIRDQQPDTFAGGIGARIIISLVIEGVKFSLFGA